jgi:hypothetical protein
MFPTSPNGILKTVFILSAFDRLGKFFQKGFYEVTGSKVSGRMTNGSGKEQ